MSEADRVSGRAEAGRPDAARSGGGRTDPGRAGFGPDGARSNQTGSGRGALRRAREVVHRPLYARVLRLRHLSPSGIFCFIFLEGAIALGILFALAELVSWWGVIVLPATVAVMVKLNDLIAGLLGRSAAPAEPVAARASVLCPAGAGSVRRANIGEESTTRLRGFGRSGGRAAQPGGERLEAHQQWVRQSATRRYE
jgi:hypothetical protein